MAERAGTAVATPPQESPAGSERRRRGAERAGARARARRRRTARLALTISTVAIAVWAGWFSPLFALDASKVELAGLGESVDGGAVRAALGPYVGTPLPRLDPGAMAVAVEGIDGVRSAVVTRKWPDGVRITVTPRVAIAAVPGKDGAYVFVDAEGVALGQSAADPGELPVVDVVVGPDHARALDAVVSVLGGLPTELGQRVRSAGAQTEDTVELTLGDGTKVVWGSASDTALKAQVVLTMLDSAAFAGVVIDVSAPTLPVTHG
ncbi:MAG TPA: FtsQ-type POTRA domain-containing protein [Demequinaceae bacterium]